MKHEESISITNASIGSDQKSCFPDFLGIGAMRSGTSWLSRCLSFHPEIWMLPIKEAHYFSNLNRKKFFNWRKKLLLKRSIQRCLCGKGKYGDVPLIVKYLLGSWNDNWYESLFRAGIGKVKGEITPAYAILEKEQIAHVHRVMPNAKIIFMIRNPIERAWSQARIKLLQWDKKKAEELKDEDWINEVKSMDSIGWNEYINTLNNWESFYPKEQIFIGFYDEIIECPQDLLLRLFSFLGVSDSLDFIPKNVSERIGEGINIPMPSHLEAFLAQMYNEKIFRLHEYFGGYATRWWEQSQKSLYTNLHFK
ncbi:sulfotransferase [Patescibacteria group bacterium]|nr:sulfotransferase [Patescibacteria group bacterium]MBU1123408.1 sulfotransferase [Patescibacteria group bacterium]MBU1911059.1 sulfotransferase [Patescibacteria group bacterium]